MRVLDASAPARPLYLSAAALALVATLGSAAVAQPAPEPEPAPAAEATDNRTVVPAPTPPPGRSALTGDGVAVDPVSHLSEALEGLPGVAASRRGPTAADPVIRGLGEERVDTRVGVVPVQGACPSRMDPPATYVAPHAIDRVTLERAGQGASFGGGGLGGRILVLTDWERLRGAPDEVRGFVGGAVDGARRGLRTEAGLMGGLPWLDFRLSGGVERFGDYTAPDGTRVPAHVDGGGVALSLGIRPAPGHRLSQSLSWTTRHDEAFPALPMDLVSSDALIYNAGYRLLLGPMLRRIEVKAGYARVDHVMSNANKPSVAKMEAETPSNADSFAATAEGELVFGNTARLVIGLDAQALGRDATRTRRMVASGMTMTDHLWPDIATFEGGLYASFATHLGAGFDLDVSARGAWATADARAASDTSLGGKTIREQYVAHYGEDAADTERSDLLGALHATLGWRPAERVLTTLHLGYGMRAPSANERYFAFAPAPGGFRVGNPTLGAEGKLEADLGASVDLDVVSGSVSVFGFHVDDFILETAIDRRDVDGDGAEDVIRGYQPVSANFVGGELGLTLHLGDHLDLPATVSYVRATNATDDKDLPLIPPLFGRAALRAKGEAPTTWWAEVGVRFAAEQNAVDPGYPEDPSPAWAVLDVRVGLELDDDLRLELGVRNLLDTTWHDHLTREAMLPVGGLAAGDEIPAPGRSFFASARSSF